MDESETVGGPIPAGVERPGVPADCLRTVQRHTETVMEQEAEVCHRLHIADCGEFSKPNHCEVKITLCGNRIFRRRLYARLPRTIGCSQKKEYV